MCIYINTEYWWEYSFGDCQLFIVVVIPYKKFGQNFDTKFWSTTQQFWYKHMLDDIDKDTIK